MTAEAERHRSDYRNGHRIDLAVRPGVDVPIPLASLARIAGDALTAAGAPASASLGVILADDRELAELNAEHMGHDGPTDVLSFPLLPPSAFPPHEGAAARSEPREPGHPPFQTPPGQRVHLGDVVVSVERAIEQAEAGRGGQTGDVRSSVGDEIRLLVVHGVLHVCGWDHDRPPHEAAMRALERRILSAAR